MRPAVTGLPRHDEGRRDHRYSIQLEFCGYRHRRHVVRFCGDYVGNAESRDQACAIARKHAARRRSELPDAGVERSD